MGSGAGLRDGGSPSVAGQTDQVRRLRLLAAALVVVAGTGCGAGTTSRSATTPSPTAPGSATAGSPAAPTAPASAAAGTAEAAAGPSPTKVLVVVEENHTSASALRGMPYLASLAHTYGLATAYRAVTHPSLPNYLAIAGGSTFGVNDDADPASHRLAGPSAFDQTLASGRTAKTYADAMPSPCAQDAAGTYAVKHNPWTYFADPSPRANCRKYDVPAGTISSGALRSDITAGTLPNVGLLIPDLCHDGHDCSLATADHWLKDWLGVILAGPDYRTGHLAIVVTFDEDDDSGDNTVLLVVVAPHTSRVVSPRAFTHYSLTRYFAQLIGKTPLRSAADAASLRADFHL
jgi:acid phosphatase